MHGLGHRPARANNRVTGRDGAAMLNKLNQDERDVAMRVVQGMRNREIAHELFVSVRTVELRLTHIYRALGVQSRAQLVAALAGTSAPDDGSAPGGGSSPDGPVVTANGG